MANNAGVANPAPTVAADAAVDEITAGVDTHRDFHLAAALDALGRVLGTERFPATAGGYAALLAWLRGFGPVATVGVEGTGSYGAGLVTHLLEQQVGVAEVCRPNRQKRRRQGKSDPLDAINAARAVHSGEATAAAKPRTGPIESVRVLRQARQCRLKARTAALNSLHALLVTAPATLRESLAGLGTTHLVTACAALHTPGLPARGLRGTARTEAHTNLATALCDAETAVRTALANLAETITDHDQHIAALDTQLHTLLTHIAPHTMAQHGVGPDTAGQLLITASANPDRLHNEAAFAALTGTAPLDASSGQHARHRLSRAGDRHANCALYRITLTRTATCPRTRTYLDTRLTPNGSNKKHLIRCLKRYITRQLYPHIHADLTALLLLDKP